MTTTIQHPQTLLTCQSFARILKSAILAQAIFPVEANGSWNKATGSQESVVEFRVSKYVTGFVNDDGDLSYIKYIKLNGVMIASTSLGKSLYVIQNEHIENLTEIVVIDCPTDLLTDSEFRRLESILRNS